LSAAEDEELSQGEIDWAHELRSRRGFVTGGLDARTVWGEVDLEDDVLEDNCAAATVESGAPNGTPAEALFAEEYSSPSTKNIWCPRVFACDPTKSTSGKPRRPVAAGAVGTDLALQNGQCKCIGRALIYRQGAFLLLMLLPDWALADGGPAFAVDHISKLLRDRGAATAADLEPLPSQTLGKRVGEGSLLHLCASLQRGLAPELELLERIVGAGVAVENHTPQQQPSSRSGNRTHLEGSSSGASSQSSSSSSSSSKRRQASLPGTVRLLYFNACNRALKSGTLYRRNVDPVLLWPSIISKATPRSSSLSLTLDSVRHRFPLPSSLLADSVEPAVLRALNDIRETLSHRAREPGGVSEACLRVSTMHRGGVWCVGRRFGGRFLFLVVDACSTLNDLYEALTIVTEEVLFQVVL